MLSIVVSVSTARPKASYKHRAAAAPKKGVETIGYKFRTKFAES